MPTRKTRSKAEAKPEGSADTSNDPNTSGGDESEADPGDSSTAEIVELSVPQLPYIRPNRWVEGKTEGELVERGHGLPQLLTGTGNGVLLPLLIHEAPAPHHGHGWGLAGKLEAIDAVVASVEARLERGPDPRRDTAIEYVVSVVLLRPEQTTRLA